MASDDVVNIGRPKGDVPAPLPEAALLVHRRRPFVESVTLGLEELAEDAGGLSAVWFEEVRRQIGTDAAHVHGGLLAILTAWAEQSRIPYAGAPVGTIKRFATGRGNAGKPDVIAAMRSRGFSSADDDEADALALLLWEVETRGGVR